MGQENLSVKFRAVVNFSRRQIARGTWERGGHPQRSSFTRAGLEPECAFVTLPRRHFQTTFPGPDSRLGGREGR